MKFLQPVLLGLLFFLCNDLSAQSNYTKLDSVASIFKSLHDNNTEKVVLQTDRLLYAAGEKMWFHAFVVNRGNNKLNFSSKNLFADLVDDHDNVITNLVLDNQHLNTNGALSLPDNLATGFYWLRFYTAKMLEEDTESIFIQPVYVLNKRLPEEDYTNSRDKGLRTSQTIHFYPERFTNIPAVISSGVLKVTDEYNLPLSVSGKIVTTKDSVVTTFTTNQFGLARITFVDEPDEKYTVIVHKPGRDEKFVLPSVDHSAAQVSVVNQTSKSLKAIITLEDSLPEPYKTILMGLSGDSLCFAAVGTGTYGITVPLNNFPGGIASLLLFDQQKHLLSERKIYIDKDNYEFDIKANKKNYTTRDKVDLDLKVTNAKGKPVLSALDAAVEDEWITRISDSIVANSFPAQEEFMLTKWLDLNQNKLDDADIDMLMLTLHPSFKFAANQSSVQPGSDSTEKLRNLIGKVIDRKSNPIKDRIVTVMSRNANNFFIDVDTTKADGSFEIPLPENTDSLSLSLAVSDKRGIARTEDEIVLDSFQFPKFATPLSLKQQFTGLNKNIGALIKRYHVDTAFVFQGKDWLQPVKVTTYKKKEVDYDESKRLSSISQIVTADKFHGPMSVGNALLMVPGVSFVNGELSIFGSSLRANNTLGEPLLVENGIAVGPAGIGYFNQLNPDEVDFIEVLRGGEAAIYGVRGGNGVISVNFRNRPRSVTDSRNNFTVVTPVTYHTSPLFFMPDYSISQIKNSSIPDPRTTIYWNSHMTTDAKGSAQLSFYTADKPTNYTLTITGITSTGQLIYKRSTISGR